MKTITDLKTKINGDQVIITGRIVEQQFHHPVQQVTVGFASDDNPHWIRHAQMSQEALFVKRFGVGCAFPLEEFVVNVASVVEPTLSYPPVFRQSKTPLTVEFSSELAPTLQWQVADTLEGEWKDLAGATSATLNSDLIKGRSCFVRCKASSEAGYTTTIPVKM